LDLLVVEPRHATMPARRFALSLALLLLALLSATPQDVFAEDAAGGADDEPVEVAPAAAEPQPVPSETETPDEAAATQPAAEPAPQEVAEDEQDADDAAAAEPVVVPVVAEEPTAEPAAEEPVTVEEQREQEEEAVEEAVVIEPASEPEEPAVIEEQPEPEAAEAAPAAEPAAEEEQVDKPEDKPDEPPLEHEPEQEEPECPAAWSDCTAGCELAGNRTFAGDNSTGCAGPAVDCEDGEGECELGIIERTQRLGRQSIDDMKSFIADEKNLPALVAGAVATFVLIWLSIVGCMHRPKEADDLKPVDDDPEADSTVGAETRESQAGEGYETSRLVAGGVPDSGSL
jgi:hypothetical protein